MRLLLLLMACFLTESASANDGDKVSLADAAQHAVEQSSLTRPDALFLSAYNAIVKWKFRPYLKEGRPQYFHGKLAFRVK